MTASMDPAYGQAIDHLWQSTVFALAAGGLAFAFRKNRAQVRYWVWLSASMKFLLPFALLIGLGTGLWQVMGARGTSAEIVAPNVSVAMDQIAQPFSEGSPLSGTIPAATHAANWLLFAVLAVWLCGFLAVAIMCFRGWLRVRQVVRASKPFGIAALVEVRSTPALLEPGVVGWLRPKLLLPEGILETLTRSQLETVLAHELSHIRRRDNLTAAIHMLVEATFWFHPMVWWISSRLMDERERACDEAVLSMGSEPRDYAESILNVCKFCTESPVTCVSGVTGSDIKRRLERIMHRQIGEVLNGARKLILATACVAAVAVPVIIGVLVAPAVRGQSNIGPVPKWDVISIKPCNADSNGTPGARGGGGGAAIPPASFSPTHMMLHCQTVLRFVQDAYLLFPNAQPPLSQSFAFSIPVEGAPDWAKTERYTIEANADGEATPEMMEGPMLQALLEARFQLKLHHETREVPVYDLVVAKGGPKLTPFDPASCTPFPPMPDIITGPPNPLPPVPPGHKYCSHGGGLIGPTAVNIVVLDDGDTIDGFTRDFLHSVGDDGRRAVDKTGLTGKYTIHLEYAPDEAARNRRAEMGTPLGDPTAPEIFTAIQEQLGLKLVPDKGPGDFLVIDHIDEPTPN